MLDGPDDPKPKVTVSLTEDYPFLARSIPEATLLHAVGAFPSGSTRAPPSSLADRGTGSHLATPILAPAQDPGRPPSLARA